MSQHPNPPSTDPSQFTRRPSQRQHESYRLSLEILRVGAGNTLTINGAVHTYDQKNQLTSLSGLDSSGAWVTVNYRYDPMGRRISSTVNNQTTLYAYDGWNVVEEYQLQPSSFILQTLHTWGLDLSGTIQGAGGVGGLLYTEDLSSGTAWHHHYDGNGNVTHLTDASATSIASYTYDAFGNTETATGPAAAANKYRFSTKPIDDTIPTHPLYYYGYRFYNPETGRWLNRDPIEEKGGLNLYGFVGNDGVGRWDVLGKFAAKILSEILKQFAQNGCDLLCKKNCVECCKAAGVAALIAAQVTFLAEIGACASLTGGWGLVGCMAVAGIDLKNAAEDIVGWGNQCIDNCKNNKPCCKVGK